MKEILQSTLSFAQKKKLYIFLLICGIILLGSGIILSTTNRTIINTNYKNNISQKHIAQKNTIEIKVKDIEVEINTPLSVDIKDYLENADELDNSIFNYIKLDTSNVKITEAGEYIYTVTYKKKKYNGKITIKEKKLPTVDLQLKNVKLEVGEALPTDLSYYISNTLTEEMKQNIILDISKVINSQAGEYQYKVTYNKTVYVGTITVTNPKVIVPSVDTEDNKNTQ